MDIKEFIEGCKSKTWDEHSITTGEMVAICAASFIFFSILWGC